MDLNFSYLYKYIDIHRATVYYFHWSIKSIADLTLSKPFENGFKVEINAIELHAHINS